MGKFANGVQFQTPLNTSPVWDDFDPTKGFARILYNPERAVQARELTQSQTILQNQMGVLGRHLFKEGSIVRGCEFNLDLNYTYLKVRDTNALGNTVIVSNYTGSLITGATSNVTAIVVNVADGSEAADPNLKTFFVKYQTSGISQAKVFQAVENISANNGFTARTWTANTTTGIGSAFTLGEGYIFSRGLPVYVPTQTIVLDRYSNTPSYKVGLNVTETITTENTDSSLNDPAAESSNYTAPGAYRLKLTANLVKYTLTESLPNTFIEMFTIKSGVVQQKFDRPQYADIMDELARRTYAESGDYTVRGMLVRTRDHLDDGTNGGYLTSGNGGLSSKLAIGIEPGEAFVKGYRHENLITRYLEIDKGTDYSQAIDMTVAANYGSYVLVREMVGYWDVMNGSKVTLYNGATRNISDKTLSTGSTSNSAIGTARVRAVVHESGVPGTWNAVYRLYLYDLAMTGNSAFSLVKGVYLNNSTEGDAFADTIQEGGISVLKESTFRSGVYPITVSNLRSLRSSNGAIDTTYQFIKKFDVTIASNGAFTLLTGDSNHQFPFSAGSLNATQKRSNFVLNLNAGQTTTNLTGTITIGNGANTGTGVGTSFTTQLNVGDFLLSNSETFRITAIGGTTSISFANTATKAHNSLPFKKEYKAGHHIDLGGTGVTGSRDVTINNSTTATVSLGETLSGTVAASIICNLKKVQAREKAKFRRANRFVQINCNTHSTVAAGPWGLGISDVFRINSIRRKTGSNFTTTSEGNDVTDQFNLYNGQLDTHYEHGQIYKKAGSTLTLGGTDRLLVSLDFFEHSFSQGDGYFSVDSYPIDDVNGLANTSAIHTKNIPIFTSPTTGTDYDLRDCIDIRPRITDTANNVTSLTNITTNPATGTDITASAGGLYSPVPNEDFTFDANYYLARKDIIVLDKTGVYRVVRGNSAVYPVTPTTPDDSMALAAIDITPYPSLSPADAKDTGRDDLALKVRQLTNRRYTMRDIGVLDNRISNIEYYTALSLLETDTADLKIIDDSGLDRFKNGILVDPLTGHGIGDPFDVDYKISIDSIAQEARPEFFLNNIAMAYNANSSNIQLRLKDARLTVASGSAFANGENVYQGANYGSATATGYLRYKAGNRLYIENITGTFANATLVKGQTSLASSTCSSVWRPQESSLATLPYTAEVFAEQPFATTSRNAAGLYWNFIGDLALVPDNDFWTDTQMLPDLRVNFEGNNDGWSQSPSTEWNSWQTRWTGTNTSTATTTDRRTGSESQATTITRSGTQTRTGIRTTWVPETQLQSLGERVVDVSIAPFMRPRSILFRGEGFRKNTTLYAFFDDEDVTDYIRPINTNGWEWYKYVVPVGQRAALANTALPALLTLSGTPPIKHSASWVGSMGATLQTDSQGRVLGFFALPSSSAKRFTVGTKTFRLSDSVTNSGTVGQVTTSADEQYTSEGLNQVKQETVIATKTFRQVQTTVTQTRQVTDSSTSVRTRTTDRSGGNGGNGGNGGVDPIAQSIIVNAEDSTAPGIFVPKLDLYFKTKHATLPVVIEIRSMVGGAVIESKALPYSRVVLAADDINVSEDSSYPTTIYFPAPVFLRNDTDYAITVKPSASNPDVAVWVAQLGQEDLLSRERVSEQPYVGVLFASANDRTWTPVQDEDMKFRLYRCVFDDAVTGTLRMHNQRMSYLRLANTTAQWGTMGEMVVGPTKIFANTISGGSPAVGGYVKGTTSTANGYIELANNASTPKMYKIINVTPGKFFRAAEPLVFYNSSGVATGVTGNVQITTVAQGTVQYYNDWNTANLTLHISSVSTPAFLAGDRIVGQTSNARAYVAKDGGVQMNVMVPQIRQVVLPLTDVDWSVKATTSSGSLDSTWTDVEVNENYVFKDYEMRVLGAYLEDTYLSGSQSLQLRGELNSESDYVSPMVDMSVSGAIAVGNIINNDSTNEDQEQGGNAKARYITRVVTLKENQDAEDLKVMIDLYQPPTTDVKVYYKILHREDSDVMEDRAWVEMSRAAGVTFYSNIDDVNDFREVEFTIPDANLIGTNNAVVYTNTGGTAFTGYKYFQIKIVLLGATTAIVPKFKKVRAIALQK